MTVGRNEKVAAGRSVGVPHKYPVLPTSIPTTSREPVLPGPPAPPGAQFDEPKKKFIEHFYDREKKEYCGRTCNSWLKILSYSIMYLVFLSTYTLIFLFTTLYVLKISTDFKSSIDKTELLTYPENGIGLTAVPTSETGYPLIWYKKGDKNDYDKYIKALDNLLVSHRRKRDVSKLGPCSQSPYGYDDKPCIVIKINRQLKWAGKPIQPNSTFATIAPKDVQRWMNKDKKKLWLQCNGYHSYDREHIGSIKYYPDPPGFDPDVFPLDKDARSPLVAVQISNFSLGMSLAVECKLWYERGSSTIEFMLYVAPEDRIVSNRSSV